MYSGDGGPLGNAVLRVPCSVYVNEQKEVIISDSGHGIIRKVTTDGFIDTCGNNTPVNLLSYTRQVVMLKSGEIYFALNSVSGSRLMKIDANRSLTTVIEGKFYGVAVSEETKDIFFGQHNRVLKLSLDGTVSIVAGSGIIGFCGDGGPAEKACLCVPYDLFYLESAKELYIADECNHVIRKVSADGIISTVAGVGGQFGNGDDQGPALSTLLYSPRGVFVTESKVLYISDTNNNKIRKVVNGTMTTFLGSTAGFSGDGGLVQLAQLYGPHGIFIRDHIMYVADSANYRIRKIEPVCAENYFFSNKSGLCLEVCYGKTNEDSDVCSGGGECVGLNSCLCKSTFYGKRCELNYLTFVIPIAILIAGIICVLIFLGVLAMLYKGKQARKRQKMEEDLEKKLLQASLDMEETVTSKKTATYIIPLEDVDVIKKIGKLTLH